MGDVYRARDMKLGRDVALKVLPDAFALDPDRLARFHREAQVLASLNHPHIAAIYGFEDSADTHALVLELVEGPTLADRIAQGAIPWDEALPIATQICDALDAAHAQGIVHRDLKPANVKVRADGTVKVLDFGLAKMLESDRPSASLSMSPTMGVQPTYAGVILGTATYMSPEQARGRAVDQRTDVWAFGCVLYEMLTARQVFDSGETVSDAIAAILTREPDWAPLPANTPASVRTLLRRCLQKDAGRRLHHIVDARIELEEAANAREEPSPGIAPTRLATPARRVLLPWIVAVLAVAVAAWALWRSTAGVSVPRQVARLEINLPPGVELFNASTRTVAVSPDASRIAAVGTFSGTRNVYMRLLDRLDATPILGGEGATACIFSPDGRSIAVVTSGGALKTISLGDGLAVTLTDNASFLNGVAWTADNHLIFVRTMTLWQVAPGGMATQLTTLGGPRKDTLHAWPAALPDARTILFGAATGDVWRIDALSLATGERHTVVERGSMPMYVSSGHLIFVRDDQVLAARFDVARAAVVGPALPILDSLPGLAAGPSMVDVSQSGTAVYSPANAVSRLVWVSRQGAEQPANDTMRAYANPRLSPDGNRLVVQAGELWLQDLTRSTFTRLGSTGVVSAGGGFQIWSPDSKEVAYRSPIGIQIRAADGSSSARTIPSTSEWDYPASITQDKETLVFLRSTQETSFDIFAASLKDPGTIRTLIKTPAYEGGAKLSPDEHWMIYVSNESGQNEVYLRPYPSLDRRWQVSTEGGTQPAWNPNGREIFYRSGDKMMAVEVTTNRDVTLSPPRLLFERRYAFGAGITIANYDVSRDGQRFIMVKDEASAARLNVVLNWADELKQRVPTR